MRSRYRKTVASRQARCNPTSSPNTFVIVQSLLVDFCRSHANALHLLVVAIPVKVLNHARHLVPYRLYEIAFLHSARSDATRHPPLQRKANIRAALPVSTRALCKRPMACSSMPNARSPTVCCPRAKQTALCTQARPAECRLAAHIKQTFAVLRGSTVHSLGNSRFGWELRRNIPESSPALWHRRTCRRSAAPHCPAGNTCGRTLAGSRSQRSRYPSDADRGIAVVVPIISHALHSLDQHTEWRVFAALVLIAHDSHFRIEVFFRDKRIDHAIGFHFDRHFRLCRTHGKARNNWCGQATSCRSCACRAG